MSGILGYWHLDGRPADNAYLISMGESMSHRGPDGSHYWCDQSIGMGHLKLHSTPESPNETLPYHDEEAGLAITADARIDNREELAAKLGIPGHALSFMPDSQLLLAAYKKWRESSVQHLLGDFAFVIWDQRQQTVFGARDHMGIKPFLYHHSATLFAFASEVRAVRRAPGVPQRVNEGRIADTLIPELEGIDKTSTFFEEIYRLPPAHILRLSKTGLSISSYWQLNPEYEHCLTRDEEYVEEFDALLNDAVRVRLRGGNVASMLSGGIDSSTVVGVARSLTKSEANAGFPVISAVSVNERDCTETSYIRMMLDSDGLNPTTFTVSDLEAMSAELMRVLALVEEPFDFSMIIIMQLYLLARKNGFITVLDGVEGDVSHSLAPAYPAYLFKEHRFRAAITELFGLQQNYFRLDSFMWGRAFKLMGAALLPESLLQMRRPLVARKRIEGIIKNSMINPAFAKSINVDDRLKRFSMHYCKGLCPTLRHRHVMDINHPYMAVGLERYARVAALAGIEQRHPLLDKRLIEYSVALPWDQKVRHGWSKYLLRRVSERYVPSGISWRRGWEHIGESFGSRFFVNNEKDILSIIDDNAGLLGRYVRQSVLEEVGNVLACDSRKIDRQSVDLLDLYGLALFTRKL